MGKKRIAAFVNGWNGQITSEYLSGFYQKLSEFSADLYTFLCYPVFAGENNSQLGELNIFSLPDLSNFDAAVVMGNTLEYQDVFDNLVARCKKAGIPLVCTGRESESSILLKADNYSGMLELCRHILRHHRVSDICYIAGTADNGDSNIRLKALRDAMEELSMQLPPESIYYSNWEPKLAVDYIEAWISSGKELPEAFICANDILAMAVCDCLRNNGINVPSDVIVTGFDDDYYARVYDPSICTVNQNFEQMGQESARLLMEIFEGKEVSRDITVPCIFNPSESCGCMKAHDFDAMRREVGRHKYLDNMHENLFERQIDNIEYRVLSGKSYDELRINLRRAYAESHIYEGGNVHIVLDPMFEKSISNPDRKLRKKGYSNVMDVVFSMTDEKIQYSDADISFDVSKLIPYYSEDGENREYVFLPLHVNNDVLGYLVIGGRLKKIENYNFFQKYQNRLNKMLENYRKSLSLGFLNKKLLELTETDALTHVKNRTAFEAKELELMARIRVDKEYEFALVMCDVNNLKLVNDSMGHDAGDEYIINCCLMVCNAFSHSPVYRIGGDEFLVVLTGKDYEARNSILAAMNEKMEDLKQRDIPQYEKLSIATGMADYNCETDSRVSDVLKRADQCMYERKMIMKGGKVR